MLTIMNCCYESVDLKPMVLLNLQIKIIKNKIKNILLLCFIGGGRFYDPRTKQSFKYDHLRKEASDYQDMDADSPAESWRSALDIETLAYTASHYRHGVSLF